MQYLSRNPHRYFSHSWREYEHQNKVAEPLEKQMTVRPTQKRTNMRAAVRRCGFGRSRGCILRRLSLSSLTVVCSSSADSLRHSDILVLHQGPDRTLSMTLRHTSTLVCSYHLPSSTRPTTFKSHHDCLAFVSYITEATTLYTRSVRIKKEVKRRDNNACALTWCRST